MDLSPIFGATDGSETVELDVRLFPDASSPRWILESRFRRPWHLKTWPRTSLRARMIYRGVWLASIFGVRMPSTRQLIKANPSSIYMKLRERSDALSVFVGTPGPNRKFVIYTEIAGQASFVKVPAEPGSFALVARETAALDDLSCDPDLKPLIPGHRLFDGHLAVDSVEVEGVAFRAISSGEILRVCQLLERRSRFVEPLDIARRRFDVDVDESGITTDPDLAARLAALRSAARKFWDQMDPQTPMTLYNAHGDFTQWNVLAAPDGSARIIDWEMYGPKPRYFDLIHYYVAQQILVHRLGPAAILSQLSTLQAEVENPDAWWTYVGHYFIVQALFYAAVYQQQTVLHAQALDQIRIWTEILERLNSNPDNPVDRS